jgi:hypothetical protein
MAKPADKPIVADHVEEDPDVSELVNRLDTEQRVSRLLRQDSELAAVVSEAANQLVRFIPDARLTLELLTDPEYNSREQLFIGISTDLEENDALEALRRFDQHWWVHQVRRARGLLCIDLECRNFRGARVDHSPGPPVFWPI